ncbi:MAG: AI-2E family transporter [Rhodospirillales bacterium]
MNRTQRLMVWAAAFTLFVLLIHLLEQILLPFVAGLGVAYLLDPLADKLEERGLSRILATTVITGVFFFGVIGIIIVLTPLLQNQVTNIAERLPEFVSMVQAWASDTIARLEAALPSGTLDGSGGVGTDMAGTIGNAIKNVAQKLWAGGVAVFEILSLLIITPIVSFYMLLKWDDIVRQIDDLLPRPQVETIRAQFREIDTTLSAFIRGQASVCLTLAAVYGISLSVIGLEAGLLIGIGAGAVSFIPYVGALSGIIMALGVAFVQFDTWGPLIAVATVFAVGQTLESYVLTPRLVGDKVGLHDLWIIFALMAGGTLFGFLGVLLAVPTAAVIGVLVRFTLSRYRDSKLYLGDGDQDTPTAAS